MMRLYSLKELLERHIKIITNSVERADADVHFSGFYSSQVYAGIMIELFLGNFFFFTQRLDPACDFLKKHLVFHLRHQKQADKTLKNIQ